MFWSFLHKVDRFRKFIILQPTFRNKLFFKNVLNKSWFPQLTFNGKKVYKDKVHIF